MNHNLISFYAPSGIKPLDHQPINSDHNIKSDNIISILDNTFDRWTYEINSETVIGEILITNVTLYCEYGAFIGRSTTNGTMSDYDNNAVAALLNACHRLIKFNIPKDNYVANIESQSSLTNDEINALLSPMPCEEQDDSQQYIQPVEENIPEQDIAKPIAQVIEDNEVNIEPVEEEPVFSADNFMDNPPTPHDGMTNDERELMSREQVPFEETTPVMAQTIANEVGLDNIPDKFTDEYRADIKKFMEDNQIPARENMNAHLERFEHGLNNQTLTPRKWIEFKKWWEQDRDTTIC